MGARRVQRPPQSSSATCSVPCLPDAATHQSSCQTLYPQLLTAFLLHDIGGILGRHQTSFILKRRAEGGHSYLTRPSPLDPFTVSILIFEGMGRVLFYFPSGWFLRLLLYIYHDLTSLLAERSLRPVPRVRQSTMITPTVRITRCQHSWGFGVVTVSSSITFSRFCGAGNSFACSAILRTSPHDPRFSTG